MNLSYIRALVTRPEPQARALVTAITAASGQAWSMPMLAIEALEQTQAMRDCLLMLDQFDKIIVTSRPAAKLGMELIEQYWPQLPIHSQWFALGSGTADELKPFCIRAQYSAQGTDSEALLQLPAFNMRERNKAVRHAKEKVLIIKGIGGRDLLEQRLRLLGDSVQILEVYQRSRPKYPHNALVKKLESHAISVILCASGETLANLGHYLPAQHRAHYRLLVPSARIARQAYDLGFHHVVNTNGASNTAMLQALETLPCE